MRVLSGHLGRWEDRDVRQRIRAGILGGRAAPWEPGDAGTRWTAIPGTGKRAQAWAERERSAPGRMTLSFGGARYSPGGPHEVRKGITSGSAAPSDQMGSRGACGGSVGSTEKAVILGETRVIPVCQQRPLSQGGRVEAAGAPHLMGVVGRVLGTCCWGCWSSRGCWGCWGSRSCGGCWS